MPFREEQGISDIIQPPLGQLLPKQVLIVATIDHDVDVAGNIPMK
jgi:hypothetical protein